MKLVFDSEHSVEAHDRMAASGVAVRFVERGTQEMLYVPDSQAEAAKRLLRENGLPICEA